MKNLSLLLILLFSSTCFGQYDSIKDITKNIDAGLNKLVINGKWTEVFDNKNEHFISHCPIFKNESNTILEFAKWDYRNHPLKHGNDLTKINLSFINFLNEKKIEILDLQSSPNKDYLIYKLKWNSVLKPNEKIILYILKGVKGIYVYNIAIYSYENELENPFPFLSNTFNNN